MDEHVAVAKTALSYASRSNNVKYKQNMRKLIAKRPYNNYTINISFAVVLSCTETYHSL